MEQLSALAASGAGFSELSAGLQSATTDLEAFKEHVNPSTIDPAPWADIGRKFDAASNEIQGMFGDSDVEDAQAEFDAAAEAIANAEAATRALADAMGVDIFGSQSAQLQQLDGLLVDYQDEMAQIGITSADLTDAFVEQETAIGRAKLGLDKLPFSAELNATAFDDLVGKLQEASRETKRYDEIVSRAELRGARQAVQAEKQAQALQKQAEALRANRDAAQQAAQGFVDFGRTADRSSFTLDGWTDKIERQTTAMRNFRVNAQDAADKGLDKGLIQHLRTLGTQGALQLERFADANETEIARANRAWASYSRESRLARRDIEATQGFLKNLGDSSAAPKIKLTGAEKAMAAAVAARAAIAEVDRTHARPTIKQQGAAAVAAAAARARAAVEAIPDSSDTNIRERGAAAVAAAAARARAAITVIPDSSDTTIREDGAAAVAAAAARARAAITSIPTSWSTTITVNRVGAALNPFADGGYTGDGGKYEPAGIVHRGEVVIPRELVKRDWPMLQGRYGHLPGMAEGGFAGRGSERPMSARAGANRMTVNLGDLKVSGVLQTPWGPAEVRGIARAEAADVYDQRANFAETQR
jgi:hypothetical protein